MSKYNCILNSGGHFSFSLQAVVSSIMSMPITFSKKSRISQTFLVKENWNDFNVFDINWLNAAVLSRFQSSFLSVTDLSFFANYMLYWMPCCKINRPKGTRGGWPCSCSILIGNRLLELLKETCQCVIACTRVYSVKCCFNEDRKTHLTCFSWSSFYCWVKWQACFIYINNNHMKKHTRHGYMEVKAVFVITMCLDTGWW